MALSVTIGYPMPNATLTNPFPVSGTYTALYREVTDQPQDRNLMLLTAPVIAVTLSRGGSNYGPFGVTLDSPSTGEWETTSPVTVPPGEDYTVTATISQDNDLTQHMIEYVDVSNSGGPISIDFPPPGSPVAPLLAAAAPQTFRGTFNSTVGTDVRCAVCRLRTSTSSGSISGGGTYRSIRYLVGRPVRLSGLATKTASGTPNVTNWEVQNLNVHSPMVVLALLFNGGEIVGVTASKLF